MKRWIEVKGKSKEQKVERKGKERKGK